jgi:secreted PhoX family phosphatase
MVDLTRRNLMSASVAAALGASVVGVASGAEVEETDTPGAPSVRGSLKRFSTTAFGAEVTGPFVFADGTLLHSVQHPSRDNPAPFDRAGVGYFRGFNFDLDGNNDDFSEVGIPDTEVKQRQVRSGSGEYVLLAQEEDEIDGGDERLGVAQTPDGTDITSDNFAGTFYAGNAAYNPDCNEFVATNDAGTEGYLFTNWENSPGVISRIPLGRGEDGEWSADLENAINVVNTEPFRELGGTRINCYGDLSPWNTMISAEENYAHPRVSFTNTVGDIVDAGTGAGLVGGAQFWNRPNPVEIQEAIDGYFEDWESDDSPIDSDPDDVVNYEGGSSWEAQGYWALGGVEFLAYHLGAEPVDQPEGDGENSLEPIGEGYPNPYRYGYFVDIREPAADPPRPVKYYVMGRASWEAPDIQSDERTVYGCSDGDSKGIYKFVADEPIPSYDDPMDVAGTLYAPKITNDEASVADSGSRNSPANVALDVEWLELGHATNAEVESWIAEYDGVTQQDYLETHAETDWTEDLEAALVEADLEVILNGNRDYVTNQEIVDWAAQYESEGPDGVDEELRKVPFLETRAAAKEIGASIEFNKAEGVDSVEGAGPGDFVYFGISEFNDALADDEGDVQMDRVDGGVVYRAELERDYDVSTLEPVITGPDFTDSPEDADDALRNIDNVYVMDDGRVLCCEDGFGGPARSYPNDGLYVYQPNVMVDVASIAVGAGSTATAELYATSLPSGFAGGQVTVTVTEPDVATITGVSFPDGLALTRSTISDDGSSATVRVSDAEGNVAAGGDEVTIASLEVRAESAGTTDLVVAVERMDDENGTALDAESRSGLVVGGPSGPPAVGDGATPGDLDDDGRFEDVNGNGRMDYDDIVLLFEEFESDAVRLNEAAFDFNENGRLDYDDLAALYEEVN